MMPEVAAFGNNVAIENIRIRGVLAQEATLTGRVSAFCPIFSVFTEVENRLRHPSMSPKHHCCFGYMEGHSGMDFGSVFPHQTSEVGAVCLMRHERRT